ncbi:MAG: HNH endonuclease [Gemmatimonadota bacterium]|nr:HNH endonuclease [Gemmatimonadota bacterium]
MKIIPCAQLADNELLAEVKRLAERELEATADLIATLAELDARRLYLGEGCSSLFSYCTRVLHLSEHAAYGRIEAARATRRHPVVLDMLAAGLVNLTTVCLLAPHLTDENHVDVLNSARHKSKREVEHLVAWLRPKPAVPSVVRKLPAQESSAAQNVATSVARAPDDALIGVPVPTAESPARPAVVAPLAPERYKVQFTVTRETYDKLRRAQELLRHTIPSGDPATIFDRALTLLLRDAEKAKLPAGIRPRVSAPLKEGSRHIPAAVKFEVWARDAGQCGFIGTNGRCVERGFLEFHHVIPFAAGGPATTENIQLRCRSHNSYEAELFFGRLLAREEAAVFGSSTRSGPS